MTYNSEIQKAYSEKDFLAIIRPAVQVTDWTLESGTVYYHDFGISDEFIEFVYQITWNDTKLTSVSTTPGVGQFWFDYPNNRIHINNGAVIGSSFICVFFEIFFATKTINTYRIPTDNTTDIVYYAPKIKNATIPQINNDELLLFGSYSGSIDLINTDSAFYVYEGASFRRKEIEIYHIVNGIDNIKLIYRGNIETVTKNDSQVTFSYRQIDFIFNRNFTSFAGANNQISKGFFSVAEFPLLDARFEAYTIRAIYGVVDAIIPVNIDYNSTPTTSNNRKWVVRNLGSQTPSILLTVQVGSTTTRIFCGTNHGLFVDETPIVKVGGVDKYCYITAVGSNYVDISPALVSPPTAGVDTIRRGTIGNVFIKDQNGTIFRLLSGRDFNEQTFVGVSGDMNVYGFVLANNFEAAVGLTLFTPESHKIFCRCYGIRGDIAGIDPDYKVITSANYIIDSLLTGYLDLPSSIVNSTAIKALSLPSMGFSIPDQLSTTFPTYREILKNLMISSLSQLYFDDDLKLNLREIGPLGASEFTATDTDLIDFSVDYNGDEIVSLVRLAYSFQEAPGGSDRSSYRRLESTSDLAKFLHEEINEKEIVTYLLKPAEAQVIADHYAIIFGDWVRSYQFKTKTQFINALIGSVFTIERTRLEGFNFNKTILRDKNVKITSIKKDLASIQFGADPQKNIEDNAGGW